MAYRKTKHPGVSCFKRRESLVAQWRNPETGLYESESLTAKGFRSKSEAQMWLKDKSAELKRVKVILEMGLEKELPVSVPHLGLAAVIERYLEDYGVDRDANLTKKQRERLKALIDFARARRLHRASASELKPNHLAEFRDYLKRLRKKVAKGKGHAKTSQPLKAGARNSYLASARAFFNWARLRGYLTLTGDDVSDRLYSFKSPRKLPVALRARELRALIVAASAHDSESFHGSRDDKSSYYTGEPSPKASPKFQPMLPLLLLLILTGMRRGEALHLKWSDVDFDEKRLTVRDDEGSGHKVKTRMERSIPLTDSPALVRLLTILALRRGQNRYVIAGKSPDTPKNFRAPAWKRMVGGADCEHVTPKDLRSTFSTYAASAIRGPQPLYLAARMGHALEVAHRHYVAIGERRDGDTVEEWLGIKDAVIAALDGLADGRNRSDTESAS